MFSFGQFIVPTTTTTTTSSTATTTTNATTNNTAAYNNTNNNAHRNNDDNHNTCNNKCRYPTRDPTTGVVDCPMNYFRSSTDIRPTFGSVLINLQSTRE